MEEQHLNESTPWYKDGLRFQCTGCGKCCTGSPGYIWITPQEASEIASLLNITLEKFIREYTRQVGDRLSLIEKFRSPGEYDCIFLQGKRCQIYDSRPKQCQTFPWWPSNLTSPEEWENAAKECEGINADSAIVSFEEITRQLTAPNQFGQINACEQSEQKKDVK